MEEFRYEVLSLLFPSPTCSHHSFSKWYCVLVKHKTCFDASFRRRFFPNTLCMEGNRIALPSKEISVLSHLLVFLLILQRIYCGCKLFVVRMDLLKSMRQVFRWSFCSSLIYSRISNHTHQFVCTSSITWLSGSRSGAL